MNDWPKTDWSHEQATEVLRRCAEAGSILNEVVLMSEATLPDEQKKRIRKAFATIIGEMFVEIEVPIHKTYPDIVPSYLDLSRPMNAPDPD